MRRRTLEEGISFIQS